MRRVRRPAVGENSPLRPLMQRRPALQIAGRSLSGAAPGVRVRNRELSAAGWRRGRRSSNLRHGILGRSCTWSGRRNPMCWRSERQVQPARRRNAHAGAHTWFHRSRRAHRNTNKRVHTQWWAHRRRSTPVHNRSRSHTPAQRSRSHAPAHKRSRGSRPSSRRLPRGPRQQR